MRHIALIDLIQRSPVLSHKFYLLYFSNNWHIGGLSSKAVVVSTLINYLKDRTFLTISLSTSWFPFTDQFNPCAFSCSSAKKKKTKNLRIC